VLDGKAIFNAFDRRLALVLPDSPKLLTKEADAQARAALRLEEIREKCVRIRP
jgi:hypothetical protein